VINIISHEVIHHELNYVKKCVVACIAQITYTKVVRRRETCHKCGFLRGSTTVSQCSAFVPASLQRIYFNILIFLAAVLFVFYFRLRFFSSNRK